MQPQGRLRQNNHHYQPGDLRISFPLIGELRETQNYPKAAAEGKGLVELPVRQVIKDLVQWKPILQWLAVELFPQQAVSAFPTIDESWMESIHSSPDPVEQSGIQ